MLHRRLFTSRRGVHPEISSLSCMTHVDISPLTRVGTLSRKSRVTESASPLRAKRGKYDSNANSRNTSSPRAGRRIVVGSSRGGTFHSGRNEPGLNSKAKMRTVTEGGQDVSDKVDDKGTSSKLQYDGESWYGREGPGLNMTTWRQGYRWGFTSKNV